MRNWCLSSLGLRALLLLLVGTAGGVCSCSAAAGQVFADAATSPPAVLNADTVRVCLSPAQITVGPGADLKIFVALDSTGPPVNAYETVVRWNPSLLQFVSVQPESLFAPYNQWWVTHEGPDSVFISHVIMQGGTTVTGPGTLSSITLHSLAAGQSTVYFEYIEFYRYGLIIPSTITHEAHVTSDPAGIGDSIPAGILGLRIAPNPVTPETRIFADVPAGSKAVLRVIDVTGRSWGRLALAELPGGQAGARSVMLGSLLSGHPPSGLLFVVLATDRGTITSRLIRLPGSIR
jgi:hypothetical protein